MLIKVTDDADQIMAVVADLVDMESSDPLGMTSDEIKEELNVKLDFIIEMGERIVARAKSIKLTKLKS